MEVVVPHLIVGYNVHVPEHSGEYPKPVIVPTRRGHVQRLLLLPAVHNAFAIRRDLTRYQMAMVQENEGSEALFFQLVKHPPNLTIFHVTRSSCEVLLVVADICTVNDYIEVRRAGDTDRIVH